MQAYDSEKAEADAMDFGTLVHSALEALHGLDTVDESEIFDVLTKRLAKNFAYKYGKNPSLALLQQKAAIERRMRRIANLRAAEISEGWQIHKVEEKFHLEACPSLEGFSWLIPLGEKEPVSSEESVRIVGKIDRIDFHPESGVYRLLDYKTSGKGPEELHLSGGYARLEEFPAFSRFECNGKVKRWLDLQLPLYRAWAERTLLKESGHSLEVGIFKVPAQPEEITIQIWDGLNDDLMESSMECARGIVRDLLDPAGINRFRKSLTMISKSSFFIHRKRPWGTLHDDTERNHEPTGIDQGIRGQRKDLPIDRSVHLSDVDGFGSHQYRGTYLFAKGCWRVFRCDSQETCRGGQGSASKGGPGAEIRIEDSSSMIREKISSLLQSMNRLTLGTLDSFFFSMLSSAPLEYGLAVGST